MTTAETLTDDATYKVAASELRALIESFEEMQEIKDEYAYRQKAVMAEAKALGYDTAVLRKVIAMRKRSADDIAEEEAILELYKQALGMG